ncbi:MAG: MBL fold metallo-hydrolase [Thermoplasmatota archaeon]
MMVCIKVLIEGRAARIPEGWKAYSTTALLEDMGRKILVDPGSRPDLVGLMTEKRVRPDEIDMIYLTHYHLDHAMNIRMLPLVPIVDSEYLYRGIEISRHQGCLPGTGIRILPTPGHTNDHSSLLAHSGRGLEVICGDLFWFQEGDEPIEDMTSLLELEDPLAQDREALAKSRRMVVDMADVIIPGHGPEIVLDELQ